ncbi:hypothetical protein M501DRAFT_1031970 [Patellaria atrata CBS 101060]|uniref:Uncharacterized protein n=1 Tax=Patellaria atrata CBS 101060 TaxID=1346257 RepID=A0A9P4SAM4_9PEZI|nr:hypothetical protein M501DRAFT_1031970 [Patellaria atrata CBS 101060]
MLAMDMTPLLMVSRILVATSDRSHHPRASISSLTMTTRELDTLAVSYLRHNSQSTVLKTLTNTETDRLYLLSPVFPTISTRKNYIYMTRTGDHQLYLELWGSMNTRGKAGNICTEYSHAYQSPEEALKYFFQDGWKPNNGTYDPTVPRSLEQKLFCVAHIVRCMTSWLYANDSVATDIGRLTYSQFHIEATAWAIVNIVVDLHERGGRFMRGIIKSEPSGQLSMDRRLSAKQRSQKIRYLLATWKSACDDALEGAWIQSIVLNPLIYRFRKIEARGENSTP